MVRIGPTRGRLDRRATPKRAELVRRESDWIGGQPRNTPNRRKEFRRDLTFVRVRRRSSRPRERRTETASSPFLPRDRDVAASPPEGGQNCAASLLRGLRFQRA